MEIHGVNILLLACWYVWNLISNICVEDLKVCFVEIFGTETV
jgi:hypothetical protein